MGNEGFKTRLVRVLGLITLTIALCGISWFIFDQVLIYLGTKQTIPDPGMNFTRLIVSMVVVAIAYTSLNWESWHTPNI